MQFDVLVRKVGTGFEAWSPTVPGTQVEAATEAGALEIASKAVRQRIQETHEPAEHFAHTDLHAVKADSADETLSHEEESVAEPARSAAVSVNLCVFGGMTLLLGLTGLVFFTMSGRGVYGPLFLFAPMAFAGLGLALLAIGYYDKLFAGR